MGFNCIWNDKPRSGIQTFFRYWAVLSLGPVLLVGALALFALASWPVLDKVIEYCFACARLALAD